MVRDLEASGYTGDVVVYGVDARHGVTSGRGGVRPLQSPITLRRYFGVPHVVPERGGWIDGTDECH